jgi:hypothetical protein
MEIIEKKGSPEKLAFFDRLFSLTRFRVGRWKSSGSLCGVGQRSASQGHAWSLTKVSNSI